MKKSLLITFLLTFVIGTVLMAQPGPDHFGKQLSKRPVIAKLNLTPEQEKQFNDINFDHQKKVLDIKNQIEKNQLELRKMIVENKIDEKKLVELTDANSKFQGEIKSAGIKRWIAINKILNDEQKQIWSKQLGMMGKMKGMVKEAVRDKIKDKIKDRMIERRPMMRHR